MAIAQWYSSTQIGSGRRGTDGFHGMKETLKTARALIFEVNVAQLAQTGVNPVQQVEHAAAMGSFDTLVFVDQTEERICRWDLSAFTRMLRETRSSTNVICARGEALPHIGDPA